MESLGGRLKRLGGELGGLDGGEWLRAVYGARSAEAGPAKVAEELEALDLAVGASGLRSRSLNADELAEMGPAELGFLMVGYMVGRAFERAASASLVDDEQARHLMKAALERYTEFEKLAEACGVLVRKVPANSANPALARSVKIARYKERKELLGALQAAVSGARAEPDDADVAREVLLISMRMALMDVEDARVSIAQEIELRSHAANRMAAGVDPRQEAQLAREDALREALQKPGATPANFVIDSRQKYRDGVFQPSHQLPRYTVEQFGEMEARRMRREAEAQAVAEHEKAVAEHLEREERPYLQRHEDDNHEALDAATAKAREWDDWKDDHNKGSGNTLR